MQFSAPLRSNSKKVMLLGSGELGKEVAIEAQRMGLEVIAVDRYENAPAHHVAHRSHVINMQDEGAVLELIRAEEPDYILPEIEAISMNALFKGARL
jgi:phosphoribosylglycinamide formyltransferase 2